MVTTKTYTRLHHAGRHEKDGDDEINIGNLAGVLTEAQTPTTHASAHQNGGADEVSVVGLSGELADLQPVKDHTHLSAGSGVGGQLGYGHHSYETVCNEDAVVCHNNSVVYV